jgi:hypothetical protein
MARVYEGRRAPDGPGGAVVTVDGVPLPLRLDLRNHSPSGFEWGYGGSGPAQLALAILAAHFGDDDRALATYQRFKARTIAGLDGDAWSLSREDIDRAVAALELER